MNKQNIGFIGCGNLALQAIKTLSGSYNIFYSNLSINQAAENLAAEKLETIDLAKKCDKTLKLLVILFSVYSFKFLLNEILFIFLNGVISSSVITFPFFLIKFSNRYSFASK